MKNLGILILIMLVTASGDIYAQEKKSRKERRQEQAEKVQKMVEAQNYYFIAQQAIPMSMRSINLTSEYDLCVNNNNVIAYLPYFGRAYTASPDPEEGGIKFDSKDFDYRLENAKKGGWIVHFTIKDAKRRINMILHISTLGSASLSVNDDSRQTIKFNGYIEERKKTIFDFGDISFVDILEN